MSIFSKNGAKPKKNDLENRVLKLRSKISEIDSELVGLNNSLVEQTALDEDLSKTLNKISLLEAEKRSIPKSIEMIEKEIRAMKADEIRAKFDISRKAAVDAQKEISPYIEKVESAVSEYLAFVKSKDFGTLTTDVDFIGNILTNVRETHGLNQVFRECFQNIDSQENRHVYSAISNKGPAFGTTIKD